MLVYRLFLSFLFINKCLQVKKLAQTTPKIHTSIHKFDYFVMTFDWNLRYVQIYKYLLTVNFLFEKVQILYAEKKIVLKLFL